MGKPHVMKRADAVIRWLERMKKSYADGDTSNAYIEAECARADIEALTHDVIAGLSLPKKPRVMPCIFSVIKVIALSFAVIMSCAYPVSRDVPVPGMAIERDDVSHEARNIPAVVIREDVKQQSRRKNAKPVPKSQSSQKAPKNTQPERTPVKTKPQNDPKPAKVPAYDRLAYLTLTGQKALNADNTTVKITGRGNNP